MASAFYAGEKAEKPEASRRLIEAVNAIYDGKFGVVFQMDDGGSHLTLLLEVESPSLQLEDQTENMLLLSLIREPQWMGWRFVTLKIPPGALCLYENQE